MGFYLRKSFRAGPIRFNLSKSGMGLSAGVKGARIGAGPRGKYVHGGRYGLYYRKYMSSDGSRKRGAKTAEGGEGGMLLLVLILFGIGIWLFLWLLNHPLLLGTAIAAAIAIPAVRWGLGQRQKTILDAYKDILDRTLVKLNSAPARIDVETIRRQQQQLPKSASAQKRIQNIEADVYQAVLDRVLDDGFVTDDEMASIRAAESVLQLDPATRLQTKKEIFSAAYIEAIENHQITDKEMQHLQNLCSGLSIPASEVRDEFKVVQEIAEAQELELPFEPLPKQQLAVNTQRSEEAYYQCAAKVLTRRKSRKTGSGYEYIVKRDGTLVLTQKRLFVVDEGTTSILYDDIADVECDIDSGLIIISKHTSSRPAFLKTEHPVYTARAIDLLTDAVTR